MVHLSYRSFFTLVCQYKRTRTPEQYEALMGLPPAEIQVILPISLQGCHELNVVGRKYTLALQQYSPEQRSPTLPPELKAIQAEELAIMDQTRENLKEALSPESFQKMETYVFIGAPDNIESAVQQSDHNQKRLADIPPHQTPLRIRYMFFLVRLGHRDEQVGLFNSPDGQEEAARLEAQGQIAPRTRLPYETIIGLSHDQVETMLAIFLEGYRALRAKEQEQKVAIKEFRARYTEDQLAQMPTPANLQQLNEERWAIPEETAMKLKQALGGDAFNKLDAWVAKHNGQPATLKATPAADSENKPASAAATQADSHE